MIPSRRFCTFASIFFAICASLSAADVPYSVSAWKEGLGNHRARIQVAEKADAVRVVLPWRSRDPHPEQKNITIVDAATGKPVENVARIKVDRETADLAFQPATAPGEYFVYFAPFKVQQGSGGGGGNYEPRKDTAAPEWLARHGLATNQLAAKKWENLPQAKVIDFQSRGRFDRFDPMELPATREEMNKLLADNPQPYLVFAEDRSRPIRMRDELPLCWIRSGPVHELHGRTDRYEYYAFQIGVYAARRPLDGLAVDFGDLRAPQGGVIPAARLNCINFGGVDYLGEPFQKRVSVPQGKVQALWCGIDVPRDAAPGVYQGVATVRADGVEPTPVRITMTISDKVRADRGDGEPERYSRIRWLDSRLGISDEPIAPYTPMTVEGRKIRCLGREVELSPTGLPTQIRSGQRNLLYWPMTFLVRTDEGYQNPIGGKLKFVKQSAGAVEWESPWKVGPLEVQCRARMEFDGHLNYTLTCRSPQAVEVNDICLQMYVPRSAATYFMGFGRNGGRLPQETYIRWKWGGEFYYDSFWIGDVPGGLHCKLRGADYSGPLVNTYWHANQLRLPDSWANGGRGGCEMWQTGNEIVTLRAYCGSRSLPRASPSPLSSP